MNDNDPAVEAEFDVRTPAEVAADEADSVEPETPTDDADTTEEVETEEHKGTTPAPENTEEPDKVPYQPPQKVKVELPKFEAEIPVDEYGNIDATKMAEYLQARDKYILDAARAESNNAYYDNLYVQREWADVSEAYPELAKDETLRTLVDNIRYADAIKGGKGSLMEAAKAIDALRQSSVEAGRTQQQATITRQKSVSTTASPRNTGRSEAAKTAQLRKQAANGSDEARIKLLSSLIDSGALNAD